MDLEKIKRLSNGNILANRLFIKKGGVMDMTGLPGRLSEESATEVPRQQGAVHVAIERQIKELSVLSDVVSRLESRLVPILGPSSPEKKETVGAETPKPDSIANKIENHNMNVELVTKRIKEIIARLEV